MDSCFIFCNSSIVLPISLRTGFHTARPGMNGGGATDVAGLSLLLRHDTVCELVAGSTGLGGVFDCERLYSCEAPYPSAGFATGWRLVADAIAGEFPAAWRLSGSVAAITVDLVFAGKCPEAGFFTMTFPPPSAVGFCGSVLRLAGMV